MGVAGLCRNGFVTLLSVSCPAAQLQILTSVSVLLGGSFSPSLSLSLQYDAAKLLRSASSY